MLLFKIKSISPLKFSLFGSIQEYSITDVFKIYFDLIIRMLESHGDSVRIRFYIHKKIVVAFLM